MSSISGIGQSVYQYQYLQGLSGSRQASQAASTSGGTAVQDTDGDSDGSTQGVSAGHQHHHGGGGEFFKQIQSAVASALQSTQSSGSASDPNQVIQSAIAQVLKNLQNGGSGTAGRTSASGADPDADGDTDARGAVDNDGSTAKSAFSQLLQSNGVDAQQFQKDFLAAIQSARSGGSADASGVFSGFPPGSVVDTFA